MGSISVPLREDTHTRTQDGDDDADDGPCLTTSLHELLQRRAATHADKTLISYPSRRREAQSPSGFDNYTGAALDRLTRQLAAHLRRDLAAHREPHRRLVVALVGASSLEYYATFLALQRLGATTMFMSPRLADQGYVHLLAQTGCGVAIASGPSLDTLARLQASGALEHRPLAVLPMVVPQAFLDDALAATSAQQPDEDQPVLAPLVEEHDARHERTIIIHSGGTTGLPKPVAIREAAWLQQAADIAGRIPRAATVSTLPLFHSFGLATLLRGLVNGTRLALLAAARPVTAAATVAALDATAAAALVTVPHTLGIVAEAPGGLARLGRLRQVISAGSAVPQALGDRVVAAGGCVFHLYGQTESGALMAPPPDDRALWSWVAPLPHAAPYLRFEREGDADDADDDSALHHLVVLPGLPQKVLADRADGAYGTKDLFRRHATRPGLWQFVARRDDIVVLLNGEKADPTPLEEALGAHAGVRVAVAFGAGRDALGVIVVRAQASSSSLAHDDYVESILPALALGNARVPAYARVSRDMVIVKAAHTAVPVTDKATVVRARFLAACAGDIDACYAARQTLRAATTASRAPLAGAVSYAAVADAVARAVSAELGSSKAADLAEDADFFDLGLDSLQASNVRSRLLREIDVDVRGAPQPLATNVVFDHPTVRSLASHIRARLAGTTEAVGAVDNEQLAQALIAKYSDFAAATRERRRSGSRAGDMQRRPAKERVLLTGATGSIGAHILAVLLQRDDVDTVFCIVRAPDARNGLGRITAALQAAQLLQDLAPAHLDKIVACPGDLCGASADGRLGLAAPTFEAIRQAATAVVHSAWPVNFNMALSSFEAAIRSVGDLVRLALRSALPALPSFTFVSSIAACMGAQSAAILERRYGWECAAPMGYGQSKWVAEAVCERAAAVGLGARVVRLGQVAGDARHGRWRAAEAYPSIVQSALTVGALPLSPPAQTLLRWLPVDAAAAAVVDIALAAAGSAGVYNVAGPRPISWNDDFLPAVREALAGYGIAFDALPPREWLRRLEAGDADPEANPPRKLLGFYQAKYGAEDAPGEPCLDMTRTRAVVPWLGDPDAAGVVVDGSLIGKFVKYWVEECWAGLRARARPDRLG